MKVFVVLALFVASSLAVHPGFNIRRPWLAKIENTGRNVVGRVTNGANAVAGDHPYQVSYQWGFLGIWEHVCGGSIISLTAVLSAGHCVTELPSFGSFRIVAGILNLRDTHANRQERTITQRVVHPLYAGDVGPYDIAVLRLQSALTLSPVVQIVRLPQAQQVAAGTAILSGWGSTSTTNNPVMPTDLQTLNVPVVQNLDCNTAIEQLLGPGDANPFDFNSNICSGPLTGGYSACSGDSGGPLAQGNTLYGVVSWGLIPCGSVGAPSVYTKVANFLDFIGANVPDLPQ